MMNCVVRPAAHRLRYTEARGAIRNGVAKSLLKSFPNPNTTSVATRTSSIRFFSADPIVDRVQSEIDSNKIVIYSKTYCPYCSATKRLLANEDPKIIELDREDDGPEIQSALLSMTDQRTVPNVFVMGNHIGGNDDTQAAARSGKIAELLTK